MGTPARKVGVRRTMVNQTLQFADDVRLYANLGVYATA